MRRTSYTRQPAPARHGTAPKKRRRKAHSGHVRSPSDLIRNLRLDRLKPSPENDRLYKPIDPADPATRSLAQRIRAEGILEPLVVTLDDYILSGHRRYAAALMAGLEEVPCRVMPLRRLDDLDRFTKLLRGHNDQRVKSNDELLRESIIDADPKEAYRRLTEHRRQQSQLDTDDFSAPLIISGTKKRYGISGAKQAMLNAVLAVIERLKKYWPLSDRSIHYSLLNDPPLRNSNDPESTYANTKQCYKDLCDLLTRARLAGLISWSAIADGTRTVDIWGVYANPQPYIGKEVNDFLKGYYRNLLISQPHHLEIIAEKLTLAPIVRPVAAEYTAPLTIGRGYCSVPPRYQMAQRFRRSGKEKLVLLILSDHDPDGQEIAHSFARSMRDDFGVKDVHAIKVALTAEQVTRFQLPPIMKAKKTSVHHAKFVGKHGDNVFELEALPPEVLQSELRRAIDSVLDTSAFNAEVDREAEDAAFLDGVRRRVHAALSGILDGKDGAE